MYKALLCLRYLRTRYIALASIISVMLGVATMIVVNSVMAGFATEMRDRIHGILADVVVETNTLDGRPDAEEQFRKVRSVIGDEVAGMTATVEVYGMLSFQSGRQWTTRQIALIGIEPEGKAQVGPLVEYLASYQPLVEDGKVVRPAERSRDEPPGWELTPSALAYRKKMAVQQQEFLRRHRQEENPSAIDSEIPHGPGADSAEEAKEPGGTKPAPGAELQNAPASDPSKGIEAPDLGQMSDEPDDPAAPDAARVVIGAGLAQYLYADPTTGKMKTMEMIRPGATVQISTVKAGVPPEPKHFNATVVDVFKSGMSEYDSTLVFCNIEQLQLIRGMMNDAPQGPSITSIQIRLKDYAKCRDVIDRLQAAFPPGLWTVRTWEQKQGPLLEAVAVESAILNVLLFLIIAVAGFGILAIFFMIVVEKTRDIGILKSLGASSNGVMSIFLSYGLSLGIVGSGVGVVLGLLFVRNINIIEKWISWLTGHEVFPAKIYYFDKIPTAVNPLTVLWVAVGAMTIAVLASILPARRAARLNPVEALRYQ